jgi:NAD(P)H-dependent flavin oxidoreductase YrpB (nitropropane dioxygenase family)
MPFKTKITEMLGIKHPIVCGGMTGVGGVELCVAISKAGGLGMLTALNSGSIPQLKKDIAECQSRLGKIPFGVNLTILPAIMPPDYDGYAQGIIKIIEF